MKKNLWLLPLLIVFLFNLPVLHNKLAWDDSVILEQQLPAITNVKDSFFPPQQIPQLSKNYFRPLVLLSFVIDKKLWQEDPLGFHLMVLLSHSINVILVYFLCLLITSGISSKYIIAFFASSLFAVFPVHAEAVAWICGRNETLATNFILLSIISYILFRKKGKRLLLFSSCLFFLGGLFCKEIAVAVLFIIPLYDLCFSDKNTSRPLAKTGKKLSIYALFVITFIFYYILRQISLGGSGLAELKTDTNLITVISCSLGYYLKVLFLPLELNVFIKEIPSSGTFFFLSSLAVIAIIYIAIKSFLSNKRIVTFCIFTSFLAILPSLSTAVMKLSETPLALRYLYFPSVGFLILLGYLLRVEEINISSQVRLNQKIKLMIFLSIFIFYSQANIAQTMVWRDDISLWTYAVEKSPQQGLPRCELCKAYAEVGQYNKAIEECKTALGVKYDLEGKSIVCNNLGFIYTELNALEMAEFWYKKAIEFRPDYAMAYFNLGYLGIPKEKNLAKIYSREDFPQKKEIFEESVFFLKKAIEFNPHYYKAHYLLGVYYEKLGQKKIAKDHFLNLIGLSGSSKWAEKAKESLNRLGENE